MPRTENQKAVTTYLSHELYNQLSQFKFDEDLRSDSQAIAIILERYLFVSTPSHDRADSSVEERLRSLEEYFNKLSDEFDELKLANFVSTLKSTFNNTVPSTVDSDVPSTVDSDVPSTVDSDVPSTVDSDVPSTVDSDVPSTVDSDVPSTVDSDVPSTVDSDVPSTVDSDVPSTVDSDVPSTVDSDVPSTVDSDVPSTVDYQWLTFEEAWATLPSPKPKNWEDDERSGLLKTRAKRQLREATTGSEHWAKFAVRLFKTIGFELEPERGDRCLRKLPEPIPHVWNLYDTEGLVEGGFQLKAEAQAFCRNYEDKDSVSKWRWEYEPAQLSFVE